MTTDQEAVDKPRPETLAEREARHHRERQEAYDNLNRRYVAGVEARRESWKVFTEIAREMPAILKGWAEVLGEVPMVRIGPEGITIIPKGVGR